MNQIEQNNFVHWKKPKALTLELFFSPEKSEDNLKQPGENNFVEKDIINTLREFELDKNIEGQAWGLIYGSVCKALFEIINEEPLFKEKQPDILSLVKTIDSDLLKSKGNIDSSFFENPSDIPIVNNLKDPFLNWLIENKITKENAESIVDRFPSYITAAFYDEWHRNNKYYFLLENILKEYFDKLTAKEYEWLDYSARLQKGIDKKLFNENFSLKQIYINLRAYFKQTNRPEYSYYHGRDDKIVVDLETELESWLDSGDVEDTIRIVTGEPGSGKSSFAKIFAARQMQKRKLKILFIPLADFDISAALVDSLNNFTKYEGFVKVNPLKDLINNEDERLLIIFDGLDEFAKQGKLAVEIADQFIQQIKLNLLEFNRNSKKLLVLISGREVIVNRNEAIFQKEKQILTILPYHLSEAEKLNYIDEGNLLAVDQRNEWWINYCKSKGKQLTGIPDELKHREDLEDITSQPLLNFLFAISIENGEFYFSEHSNVNSIYNNLLESIYERDWAGKKQNLFLHKQDLSKEDFMKVIQEIAVSSWHGSNIRTTTIKEIEKNCANIGISKNSLELFKDEGALRFLLAFYFRQHGRDVVGEPTFEFTHKSFGEYLISRRIVDLLRPMSENIKNFSNYHGWSEEKALEEWVKLTGPNPMDEYIFKYIYNELLLTDRKLVEEWQATLCGLIKYIITNGLPMDKIPLTSFNEKVIQARNAEESLLVLLNACARVTKKVSEIEWPTYISFSSWIKKIKPQRDNFNEHIFVLDHLSYLSLKGCKLLNSDFYLANLNNSDLSEADLRGIDLSRAQLVNANLAGVDLSRADLSEASLTGANLSESYLGLTDFSGANLSNVDFSGANLSGSDLSTSNLSGARFDRAKYLKYEQLMTRFPIGFEPDDYEMFEVKVDF